MRGFYDQTILSFQLKMNRLKEQNKKQLRPESSAMLPVKS